MAGIGQYQNLVDDALRSIEVERIIERIWQGDHSVWRPQPDEISNRLGWLDIAERMSAELDDINALVQAARDAGYTHALLMGMGGSSLAPEVFRMTFGVQQGYLDLAVLDSTTPGAVLAHDKRLNPARTLYIVSTKSGGTVETLSFFKYFYNRVAAMVGAEHAGDHFIAITDAGSSLEKLAQEYGFRKTFLNDPNIGGRYSALSHFGLVPAALIGMDVRTLLERAVTMQQRCAPTHQASDNPGAWLGVVLGELAKAGRDKATFVTPPAVASFGDWVEQLIAESTGKEGKGILPVVGEPLGTREVYGDDRVFVHLKLEGDDSHTAALQVLEQAGHPLVTLSLSDVYDLGAQFFLWEMAIAVAGQRLDIQPFDQPNVESAKVLGRRMVAAYAETGALPAQTPLLTEDGVGLYGEVSGDSLQGVLAAFLRHAGAGSYIALQAYVPPDEETDAALLALRTTLRDSLKVATTAGYGPRFLHSTGQLHKGDAGNGLFIQFTHDPPADVAIPDRAGQPDSSITFGVLALAQALGDAEALRENGRHVLRLHLHDDVVGGLRAITAAV